MNICMMTSWRFAQKVVTNLLIKSSVFAKQSKTLSSWQSHLKIRSLHCSVHLHGLEEFFDDSKNFGKRVLKSGAPWTTDLLRRKSLEDLHKLWFVLLKERNMLQTLDLHCRQHDEPMPGPDRLEKVAESMSNLRDVIMERDKAQNFLVHGRPTEHGGEWRKNPLGGTYWYEYKEHLIPKELQEVQRGDRPVEMAYFQPKLEEWHLRRAEKAIKSRRMHNGLVRRKWQLMRKANPHLPVRTPMWWKKKFHCKFKYGIHPEAVVMMPHYDDRLYFGGRPKHKY